MKLYGDPSSSSTRRVFAVLYHVGADFDFQLVDLFKGEHQTPEFLALNANGMVPVLVDDVVTLHEASAINLYLVEKFGSNLLPRGKDRFLALQWMFWAAEHWRQGPAVLFSERVMKLAAGLPPDLRAIADAEASIRRSAAVLEKHLQSRRYVVGERVTLADIDLAATFTHLARIKPPYCEYPHVMAWQQRLVEEDPAWALTRSDVEEHMDQLMSTGRRTEVASALKPLAAKVALVASSTRGLGKAPASYAKPVAGAELKLVSANAIAGLQVIESLVEH